MTTSFRLRLTVLSTSMCCLAGVGQAMAEDPIYTFNTTQYQAHVLSNSGPWSYVDNSQGYDYGSWTDPGGNNIKGWVDYEEYQGPGDSSHGVDMRFLQGTSFGGADNSSHMRWNFTGSFDTLYNVPKPIQIGYNRVEWAGEIYQFDIVAGLGTSQASATQTRESRDVNSILKSGTPDGSSATLYSSQGYVGRTYFDIVVDVYGTNQGYNVPNFDNSIFDMYMQYSTGSNTVVPGPVGIAVLMGIGGWGKHVPK